MESHGVLVGWSHQPLGDKVIVSLQSLPVGSDSPSGDIDQTRLLMTRSQAGLLANQLFKLADQAPPAPEERSLLRRLFG